MRPGVERRHHGMALLASLVVLLILALLAAALLDTHAVQLRMAAGQLAFVRSRQAALAQLETWLDHLGLSVPAGVSGDLHCPAGRATASCTYPDLPEHLHTVISSELLLIDAGSGPPPRRVEDQASSAIHYRATHYEVTARAQASEAGPTVSLTQGVLVLHPGAGL